MKTRSFLRVSSILSLILFVFGVAAKAQNRRPFSPNQAVVVDERLSVLRSSPTMSGKFLRRVGRGRAVTVLGQRRAGTVLFYQVSVSSRTRGWMLREALVSPKKRGEDARLLRLIKGSEDFDLLARARIFLDVFPRSPLRPQVLLLLGHEAEKAAAKVSRDANRRLKPGEMQASGAPVVSYYLNYSGLDRYSRQGIRFTFNISEKRFHYDGEAWREIVRRYPSSEEAVEARKRLALLAQ